jgi:hypothetical protein
MVSATILTMLGCLERITGENIPLDPRFYQGAQEQPSQDQSPQTGPGNPGDGLGGPAPPHGEGNPDQGAPQPNGEAPWASYAGETTLITGTIAITSGQELAGQKVLVDVMSTENGQQTRAGRLYLDAAGSFELNVPINITELRLEAFQDAAGDGPSETDPYAEAQVMLPLSTPLLLTLEVGARGRANPQGTTPATNPDAPPQPTGQPEGVAPPEGLYFPDAKTKIKISGVVGGNIPSGKLMIDVFKADGEGGNARTFLGKIPTSDTAFSLEVPTDFGNLELEAYIDLTGDGRSGDDISVTCPCNPLKIESTDIFGLIIPF